MTSRTRPTLQGAAWLHQGSKGTGERGREWLQRAVRLGQEADLPHVFLLMAMPVRAADVGERAVRHEPLETARGAAHREVESSMTCPARRTLVTTFSPGSSALIRAYSLSRAASAARISIPLTPRMISQPTSSTVPS